LQSNKDYSEKNLGRTLQALPFRRQSALSAIAPSGSHWKRFSRRSLAHPLQSTCFDYRTIWFSMLFKPNPSFKKVLKSNPKWNRISSAMVTTQNVL
ncbi:hypothetical protein, partial [Peribacillus frigoritolerans]|uniref:hypothetical protein n=1 Tax=Peribacillus frigoritolerans TaxID=450367 RepID=UPI002280C875